MQTKQVLKFLLIGLLPLLVATSCLASDQYLPFDPNNTFELSISEEFDSTSFDQGFDTLLNDLILYCFTEDKYQESCVFCCNKYSFDTSEAHAIRAPPLNV